jgi:long-chain acyl-CoA synthetase
MIQGRLEGRLATALLDACRRHADRVALEGDGARLTYRELEAQARALAAVLRDRGAHAGAPVIVQCSNHPCDFVGFLGAWLAGVAAAPIHRSTPSEVVASIAARGRCRLRIDLLDAAVPSGVSILAADGTDRPPPRPDGGEDDDDAADDDGAGDENGLADPGVLHDAALVIFTSGSTGLPKGVVLSHRAFHGKLLQNQRRFDASSRTVSLLVLNDTFSFGIWVALMTLLQGGRVVMHSRFVPSRFVNALAQDGITFAGVVPTMIRATFAAMTGADIESARTRVQAAGTLRQVVIGGEPLGRQLSAELRRFIAPAQLYDVYGLTETSTSDFVLDPRDYPARESSIGKPAPGIRFRIVDPDSGQACAPNVTGELQLRTPYIMSGYLGDPALSRAAFSDGWFRTADLAIADDDGFVTIVGRLKELIVRGGNKITPAEVERALLRCTGVAGALVAGMPDPILGQRIHALLVPRAGERIDLDRLRGELEGLLEKHKRPDAYHVGAALPTGRTGKIDRGELQRWLAAGTLQPASP